MARAVLLSGVVAIIVVLTMWWLAPLLLLAYSLLMLVNPERQLPHDQLFRTVVVGGAAPVASQEAIDQVRAHYGDLPAPEAKTLVGDLDNLRRRARGALHLASVPMVVLGLIALGAAAVNWDGDSFDTFLGSMIYWALAAPLGLAVTAWWFGRQQHRRGSGPGWHSTVVIAILTVLASVLVFFLPVGGFLTGAGFLAVSITQRSAALVVAAGIFAVISTMESPWMVVSNALTSNSLMEARVPVFDPDIGNFATDSPIYDLMVEHGSAVVFALLGCCSSRLPQSPFVGSG